MAASVGALSAIEVGQQFGGWTVAVVDPTGKLNVEALNTIIADGLLHPL